MSKNVKKRRKHCPSFHFSPLWIYCWRTLLL